jgi:hypothetical protein
LRRHTSFCRSDGYESLHPPTQGAEQGGYGKSGSDDGQGGLLAREDAQGGLQSDHAPSIGRREQDGEGTVDEGTVDEEVYVVEAVAQDGQATAIGTPA